MENSVLFDEYRVKITITNEMLGTNPIDPKVMDTHILDRQRKLIAENSSINKKINKYLDAKTISKEDGELELKALRLKIDEVIGDPLTDEEFQKLVTGDFKKITDLRESMKELDEKGITCFFRNPDDKKTICIGSHMIMGFLKAASEAITRTQPKKNGTILQSASYTQSIINQHVAILPKFINASKDIVRGPDGKPDYCQRSLRAMTAQGPRISLAKSEVLPEGTVFDFTIRVLKNSPLKNEHIQTMLSYGMMHGVGQWRGSGSKGTFEVVEFQHV